jgi:hypothetical protein
MTNRIASALVVLAVALGITASAEASAIRVSDGSTTQTVTDGSWNDLNFLTDAVTYSGIIGGWTFNLTLGAAGSDSTDPSLSLSSLNVSSLTGGTFTIMFSDTGYTSTNTSVLAAIDGATTGSVTYNTYKGTNEFQTSTLLTSENYSGVFSDTNTAPLVSAGNYSLTQVVTIKQGVLGSTWFNASLDAVGGTRTVSVPDGGSTAMSLGIALLGLAALKRRFPALLK